MKTRDISITFQFDKLQTGVCLFGTRKPERALVQTGALEHGFFTTMPSRRFSRDQYLGYESVLALSEEERDLIFQENIDELTRKEVDLMFTFRLRKGSGSHVWFTQESDHHSLVVEEMLRRNVFIISQMIRFGYINRVKKNPRVDNARLRQSS